VEGFSVQFFDNAATVFLLPDVPGRFIPVQVLSGPLLNALALGVGLEIPPGAEDLVRDDFSIHPEYQGLVKALLEGMRFYGIPLSGIVPRSINGTIRQALRFSKGWMILEE
jgi:hypothetical protein